MGINFKKPVPTPEEIREQYKVPQNVVDLKAKRDQEIKDVLTGKDDRFLVVIGPCSADNSDSVCDYLERLAKVNEKVQDKLIIIPRVYTNNQEQLVKDIREWYISRIRSRNQIF